MNITRHLTVTAAASALALLLAACGGDEATLVRTSDSPFTLVQTQALPVYRSVCETRMVYGPDVSCGTYTVCHKSNDALSELGVLDDGEDLTQPSDDESYAAVDEAMGDDIADALTDRGGRPGPRPPGGGHPGYHPTPHPHPPVTPPPHNPPPHNPPPHNPPPYHPPHNPPPPVYHPPHHPPYHPPYHPAPVCHTYRNSCYHPETFCSRVLDHTTQATLRLNFDPRAVLAAGEKEDIRLSLHGEGLVRTLRIAIKSKRYSYDYPHEVTVDLSGPVAEVNVPVRLIESRAVTPVNSVEVLNATYLDAQTLKIEIRDPQARAEGIARSIYRFDVMRGLRKYFEGGDAEIDSTMAEPATDGSDHLVFVLKKSALGSAWKHDPDLSKDREYKLRYCVSRVGTGFTDDFSKDRETHFRN